SELTGLQCQDVVLGAGAHVHCSGKGRKERCTPLRQEAAAAVRGWLRERQGGPVDPVFPNARGGVLSRDGGADLLAKHLAARQHGTTATRYSISASRPMSCAILLLWSSSNTAWTAR